MVHRTVAGSDLDPVRGQRDTLDMMRDKVAIVVRQLLPGAARAEVIAERGEDERLDVGGGNAAD